MQSTEDKKKKKRDDCLIRKKKGGKILHARYKNRHAVLNKRTIGKHKKKKKKEEEKKKRESTALTKCPITGNDAAASLVV